MFIYFLLLNYRLLRCQSNEEEIEFFSDISRKKSGIWINGNISVSNIRIVWYNPENPSEKICLSLTVLF
jgi:hypothetical protein